MKGIRAWQPVVDSQWFPSVQLGFVILAWGLWYQNTSRGWVVAVALIPILFRLLAGRRPVRATPLDIPLLLFLLTAVVGVWAAYDRNGMQAIFPAPVGWQKLWGLLLAALGYYALASLETAAQNRWALAILAGLGALVAAWFVATNDWGAQPAKWDLITRLGKGIQALAPSLSGHRLNANVAGGLVAPLLPLGLGLAAEGLCSRARKQWIVWGCTASAMMAFCLLLTTARGSWLAVATGAALGAAWWLAGRVARSERRPAMFGVLVGLGLLAGALIVVLVPSLRIRVLGSEALANRLSIYSQALLLARDYPFTGSGLGEFALVHSTYALLIHVPILAHAHALLMNIAIEQGVLGAVAAACILLGAGWRGLSALSRPGEFKPVLAAGMISLAVLFVHGLVDDPLYSSRGIVLLWIPAGVVAAALPDVKNGKAVAQRWRWAAVTLIGLALVLVVCGRTLAAAWYANLGAVAQTRAELPAYDCAHFDNPTFDQIRQRTSLSAAERHFACALAFDTGQATARARLAQIALGCGEYEEALMHTQAAWKSGHRDRVTRLLLGDALVATGQVEQGTEVVRGLVWAEGRLQGQAWYRYWVHEDYGRAANAWKAALILDPEDVASARSMAKAEQKATNP